MKRIIYCLAGGLCCVAFLVAGIVPPHTTPFQYPDLPFFPKMLPTDNAPTVEGVALGRYLFYDPILSEDCSISCASCHQQQHAFADNKRLSAGVYGRLSKRNSIPLFNLVWNKHFFWDGRARSIEEQVLHPVRAHEEMNLDWEEAAWRLSRSAFYAPKFEVAFGKVPIDSTLIARAIAQFERTLISHNSKYDQVLRKERYFSPQEYRGFVFANEQSKGNCMQCHSTDSDPLGTSGGFSNNGLESHQSIPAYRDIGRAGVTGMESDIGLFKIPSLRNVAVTAPYMHDGRFSTLAEVLHFYTNEVHNSPNLDPKMAFAHSQLKHLSAEEKDCILAFLHTLTDSVFLTDESFSNPFVTEE